MTPTYLNVVKSFFQGRGHQRAPRGAGRQEARGAGAVRCGLLKGGHSSGLNQHHHFAAHFFPPAWQVVARLQWRTIKPWRGTGEVGRGGKGRGGANSSGKTCAAALDRCKRESNRGPNPQPPQKRCSFSPFSFLFQGIIPSLIFCRNSPSRCNLPRKLPIFFELLQWKLSRCGQPCFAHSSLGARWPRAGPWPCGTPPGPRRQATRPPGLSGAGRGGAASPWSPMPSPGLAGP